MSVPFITHDAGVASDGWAEPDGRGVVGWQTLISADKTPSEALTAGIAIFEPGGHLALHRHAPAELYFVLEGIGIVSLEGVDHPVRPGDCVYIPPMAEHGCRNPGPGRLRFLYIFPTSSFAEVTYLFSPVGREPA
jgi:mannose-6-phosphate isomerase-like protein (cupin superfamily)